VGQSTVLLFHNFWSETVGFADIYEVNWKLLRPENTSLRQTFHVIVSTEWWDAAAIKAGAANEKGIK